MNDRDLAALRGNPSFVWRAGQERRFDMVREWLPREQPDSLHVLDVGCGIGAYSKAFREVGTQVAGIEVELERAIEARQNELDVAQSVAESLPYPTNTFDVVFSHEVLEHVKDDAAAMAEMVRVCRPGGRVILFCPNRWFPFETHGHYWRGKYHFGNTPLINYLPRRFRDKLAPHVRAYSKHDLERLVSELDVGIVFHSRIFPGFDNIVARWRGIGQLVRKTSYWLEKTPLRLFGLSHLLVLQKD